MPSCLKRGKANRPILVCRCSATGLAKREILGPIIEVGALSPALVPGPGRVGFVDARTGEGLEGLKPKHSARLAPQREPGVSKGGGRCPPASFPQFQVNAASDETRTAMTGTHLAYLATRGLAIR